MIIKEKLIVLILILTFIYSNPSLESFSEFDNEHIDLFLDPYYNTFYKMNLSTPNFIQDYDYDILKIDGSMKYPIGNMIPKDLFIECKDTVCLDFSQITITQNKQDKFFDTSIGYIGEDFNKTIYKGIVESKSIVNNLSQNYFLNIKSADSMFKFNTAYLYHYENIPIYNIANNLDYKRMNESFIGGIDIGYNLDKINIEANVNFHYSSNDRKNETENLLFDTQVYWSSIKFNYSLFDNLFFVSNHSAKSSVSEFSNQDGLSSRYINNDIGLLYQIGNYYFHANLFYASNTKLSINYNFKYGSDDFYFELKKDNITYIDLLKDDNSDFLFKNTILDRYEASCILKYPNVIQDFSIGKINENTLDYNYLIYRGEFHFDMFKFEYLTTFYDTNDLFLKNYAKYSIEFSPGIYSKSYRPYIKVSGNYLNLNSNYNINNSNLDIFDLINNSDVDFNDFNVINGEVGIVFNSMKIAFEQRNLINEYEYYSNESYPIYPVNYMLSVIWIFED